MKINPKKDIKVAANNRIEDFVYLDSKITANEDSTIDVQYRVTKARANKQQEVIQHQDPNQNQDIQIKNNWSPPTWF